MSDTPAAPTSADIDRLAVNVAASAAPIFAANHWTWTASGGVPDAADIAETLCSLIGSTIELLDSDDAIEGSDGVTAVSGTGRFTVTAERSHDGHVWLSVDLELGDWGNHGDE